MEKVTRKSVRRHQLKKKIFVFALLLAFLAPAAVKADVIYMQYGRWAIFDSGWWFWGSKTVYSNYNNYTSGHESIAYLSGRWSAWSYADTNQWSYASKSGNAWDTDGTGDYDSFSGLY